MAKSNKKAAKIAAPAVDPYKSIYRQRQHEPNFGKTPWCLYLYYIGEDTSGTRFVRHYFHNDSTSEMRRHEVKDILRNLALNAQQREEDQVPPPDGAELKYIVWRRRSYIAFLIDRNGNEYFTPRGAVTFEDPQGVEKNHSFFDGWDLTVDTSQNEDGTRYASAVVFVNHMTKDQSGQELDASAQHFPFRLHTNQHPLYPDSGGTNMGPPIGPP